MRKTDLCVKVPAGGARGAAPVCLVFCLVAAGCYSSRDYLERGDKATASRKYGEALLDYQKAIQKDPQSAAAFHKMATLEGMMGNLAEAATNLEKALELDPANDTLRGE